MIAKREWIIQGIRPKLPPYVVADGFDTETSAHWFKDNVLKPQRKPGCKTVFEVKEKKPE